MLGASALGYVSSNVPIIGSRQGSATTINVAGASLDPLPQGMAYDIFRRYGGAPVALAVIAIGCAVAVLFIRIPEPVTLKPQQPS